MAADPEKTVFISYRRSVSAYFARAIFMDLRAHGYDVFMDVESIDSGTFDTIILNQIAARAHFVVILTPGSVERCAEPGDWLRREIETAMELGRNVVPVLAHDFSFGDYRGCFTGKLSNLPRYSALTVPHDYFDAAMERLRTRFLKQPVTGAIRPTPAGERAAVRQKVEEAASRPAPTEAQLTAEQWFERGLARDKSDLDGKIADYTEAIRLDAKHALAYNNRGWARHNQGNLAGAISDFDEAIRLDPKYTAVYINRGEAKFAFGQMQPALSDFERAYDLDPVSKWSIAGLAITLHALGRIEEAHRHWRALIEKDTRYRDADWVGKEFHWRLELVEEARKLIGKL